MPARDTARVGLVHAEHEGREDNFAAIGVAIGDRTRRRDQALARIVTEDAAILNRLA